MFTLLESAQSFVPPKGDDMLARLQTYSLFGIEAVPVDVEVDVSGGALPATVLVGMPDTAIRESTHRVARAMVNSGFNRPNDRIVVNLAPAELPKQAATFDLPITLGILAGSGQVSTERLADYAVVGELSLEGSTRPARGALSIAMAAAFSRIAALSAVMLRKSAETIRGCAMTHHNAICVSSSSCEMQSLPRISWSASIQCPGPWIGAMSTPLSPK
jgi:predicted ATPase with chaperone activity